MTKNEQNIYSLYKPHNLCPVHKLCYGWTGWASQHSFPPLPPSPFFDDLIQRWNNDGLKLLEKKWEPDYISLTFNALPTVSPVLFAGRVKGRLQYALRSVGTPVKFSRKLAVRSIGSNTREIVEAYIRKQVERDRPADPRYEEMLKSQSINDFSVDLSRPIETASGRYWYNLHIVLVVQGRYRMGWGREGKNLVAACRQLGKQNRYRIGALSAMPEHLHIALGGNIEQSPEDIALSFQNYLAESMGRYRIWQDNYYVGTFGEYTIGAVRGSR